MIQLLHAPIDPKEFHRWAAERNMMSKRNSFDIGAAFHALLTETFGYGTIQPFRVFSPQSGPWSLYGYVEQEPESLLQQAQATAMPEVLPVLPLDTIRFKSMPEIFSKSQRLGFDCLVRPIVRGKNGERDAFQHTMELATAEAADDRSTLGREEVYGAWLTEKLKIAVTVEAIHLARFERRKVLRNGRMTEGPDATLHGTMRIEDPEAFRALLKNGVGRHKAYGYGMILLRPPGRTAPER